MAGEVEAERDTQIHTGRTTRGLALAASKYRGDFSLRKPKLYNGITLS